MMLLCVYASLDKIRVNFFRQQMAFNMSQDIVQLQEQIQQLQKERIRNNSQQKGLQEQIRAMMEDNIMLHEQLDQMADPDPSLSDSNDKQPRCDSQQRSAHNHDFDTSHKAWELTKKEKKLLRQAQIHNSQCQKKTEQLWLKLDEKDQTIKKLEGELNAVEVSQAAVNMVDSGETNRLRSRIDQLEEQVERLSDQNEKLLQLNDSILSNFNDLKQNLEELQGSRGSRVGVKDLEAQVEMLTGEMENIISINRSLNSKISDLKSAVGTGDKAELAHLRELLKSREVEFDTKEQVWVENFNHIHNEVNLLKSRIHGNSTKESRPVTSPRLLLRPEVDDDIQWTPFTKQQRLRHNTINVNPGRRVPNYEIDLESSKEAQKSQVQVLIPRSSRLDHYRELPGQAYNRIVDNTTGQYPYPTFAPQSPWPVTRASDCRGHESPSLDSPEYYKWMSLQSRIMMLRQENQQLRRNWTDTVEFYL